MFFNANVSFSFFKIHSLLCIICLLERLPRPSMKMFCQKKPTPKPKKPKNQIKKDETAKEITSKNLSGVKKTSH